MDKFVVCFTDYHSPMAESIRTLRINLQYASVDKELNSLVLTSSTPSEGKSTLATNLAVAYAHVGKRVLLIDADLRKPTLHKAFGFVRGNMYGLSSLITGGCTIRQALQPTGDDNLFVITSGPIPPNSAELLGSQRTQELLRELQSDFDMIVIDTPPVMAASDAMILSTYVSGTIFVIEYGQVEKRVAREAIGYLRNVKANLVGVVINKFPVSGDGHYF